MRYKIIYILFCFLAVGKSSGQLVFQHLEHDYGKVDKAKSLLSEFIVTNTGYEDAVILRIDAGPDFSFSLNQNVIKPGKSDTIRLFLQPNQAGKFKEQVQVYLSSQDKPVVLNIQGEIVSVDPDPLATCFSFREAHPDIYKEVKISEQYITVLDKMTNQPIDGAFVQLFNYNNRSFYQYTNEKGEVKLSIQPNMYDFSIRADFYKMERTSQYLAKDARIIFRLERIPDLDPPVVKKDSTPVVLNALPLPVPPDSSKVKLVSASPKDTVVLASGIGVVVKDNVPVKNQSPSGPELVNGVLNEELYAPSNVVFLIDLSSSMNEPGKLDQLKAAMKILVQTLRPIDKLSIVVYAETARIMLQPTLVSNKDSLFGMIDKLKASGLTAANRGLKTAYELAASAFIPSGNNQVILATDGMFNLNKSDEALLPMYSARPNKIILSVVAFGNSSQAKQKLSHMADQGKGDYIEISGNSNARGALLEEIKNKSRR